MGKIKKVASSKHEATISSFLSNFIDRCTKIPVSELPAHLASFPRSWPFPRGDVYHWIGVLNHFDEILNAVIEQYNLQDGPQTKPFGVNVLLNSFDLWRTEQATPETEEERLASVKALGYGLDGDRELVESILTFSQLLQEKCGNRSLYSSSDRLSCFLNTTSDALLITTLRLALTLAQRYHARQRTANSQHLQQSLLAAHYNIDLEKVQKLASPFSRPNPLGQTSLSLMSPSIAAKGKEKIQMRHDANDMIALARENTGWEDWGHVRAIYYPSTSSSDSGTRPANENAPSSTELGHHPSQPPTTPTPLRRSQTAPTTRWGHMTSEESPNPSPNTPSKLDELSLRPTSSKLVELSAVSISANQVEYIMQSVGPAVPKESRYDFLHRLRVARALTQSHAHREQLLAIRILALTNLAYVYPEAVLQQKILQHDSDQPKRLQLAYQLAELVHLGASGDLPISRTNQAFALNALEALALHKSRSAEVCAALNVNVNHGVLMFLTRKWINELAAPDNCQNLDSHQDEWRDAWMGLLRTLPSASSRTPETLVAAGLLPLFVEVLTLRTEKARRVYPKVLEFLDTFVHAVRDALGTFATARGLDSISELIGYETKVAYDNVTSGNGLPPGFKTPSIDYDIPYSQQQSLRMLFRFVNHIMQHNGGGYDRLLRNLIDSPPLLMALRLVFEQAKIFGSHVWSGAVNILSSFIHNEPTSYAVIAEAGLSKSLLEAIVLRDLKVPEISSVTDEDSTTSTQAVPSTADGAPGQGEAGHIHTLIRPEGTQLARGILPATEAMSCIPQAFGAICLNSAGLDLFQSSGALESYFEIFESPEHVKCMKDDPNLVRSLGAAFDELVRHHPPLKQTVMTAVTVMVARIGLLCKVKAWKHGAGTKLWTEDAAGEQSVVGGFRSLKEEITGSTASSSQGIATSFLIPELNESAVLPNGAKIVLGDVHQLGLPLEDGPEKISEEDGDGLTVDKYLYPVLRFLGAFFENQSNCTSFLEFGGGEFVLDFATLPSLPSDFRMTEANNELTSLVHMMAETKPHMIMPSLLNRVWEVADSLRDFWAAPKPSLLFTPYTKPDTNGDSLNGKIPDVEASVQSCGTRYAKRLVAVHALVDMLREVFEPPMYQTRPSQQTSVFTQVNLADKYAPLITALGQLQAACVWEEISIQRNTPDHWNETNKFQGFELGNLQGLLATTESRNMLGSNESQPALPFESNGSRPDDERTTIDVFDSGVSRPNKSAVANNTKTLAPLLGSLPSSITGFFHLLGHGLIGKPSRRTEPYQRQNAFLVADSIANVILQQLRLDISDQSLPSKDHLSYLIVVLSAFSQLLFETTTERSHSHCLTLILWAFKKQDGLGALKNLCRMFLREMKSLVSDQEGSDEPERAARLASVIAGIRLILNFFSEVTSARYIIDSTQTQALATAERDRDRPDYFQAAQFLVDLRMESLPMVREMWSSDFVDHASSSAVKCLVDILRSTLDGEYESGAARQSDTPQRLVEQPKRLFAINRERIGTLTEKGYDHDLVCEALYRCNNSATASEEYCKSQNWLRPPARQPPLPSEIEPTSRAGASSFDQFDESPATEPSQLPAAFLDGSPLALLLSQAPRRSGDDGAVVFSPNQDGSENESSNSNQFIARALNHILNDPENLVTDTREARAPEPRRTSASDSPAPQPENVHRRREVTTIEDLDAEREKVRSNLIERCLDVLNVHHDITFELADLIAAATKKHRDAEVFRRDIGETLVQSLVSLQTDEDLRPSGKKIAAYANLLALVLQEKDMYTATLNELKECFVTFIGFLKIPPSDKANEESSPWIGQVLLVIEKLLSDDAQPPRVHWMPPLSDEPVPIEVPAQLDDPLVSLDEKSQLFEALLEILPRIGKDDSLALSTSRILVILTRHRSLATRMGEKRNLQRLFVMLKQLSSSTNDKLHSTFMLILRHIVEDDEAIRQIMRSEIVANFESRPSRPIDTTSYVRQMYHLVLRAPELFVEITNEKLKLQRYDPHQRPQALALKTEKASRPSPSDGSEASRDVHQPNIDTTTTSTAKEKAKLTEVKLPVVDNPDGVIHYLLSELLSYKDVDDKEPPQEDTEISVADRSDTQTDVEMSNTEPSPAASSADLAAQQSPKKTEKSSFKADEHPIYIYRVFLLQCLTELLSSYNRTKVEFINFSRRADPLSTTPSKPRSTVLNYLLNVLVPVGTLEHEDSVAFKKRSNTSSWAMRVIVALCTRTGEFGGNSRKRSADEEEEDEPDLLFVRKFVLEHALKSYKDAMASNELLDMKYSRLMCLADLFDKMLTGYSFASGDNSFPSSTRQLAKTMFEKHFISALTSSIADVDLNFPSSRRVVKYILRPLNKLTQTAVILSESSSISSLGDTEEGDISSATSVTEDMHDDREETPDLFRHSTLGMLEPSREEETSEEESEDDDDEEIYDDEYGDEMDYEDELPDDDGEVVSDEDDDENGPGPIEGLPGDTGMDIEVLIDEDEDDEDDDDDDDDDNEDDDSDMDEDDEVMAGEITGDNDNDSLEGGDEDEWESDDASDEEAEMLNEFENEWQGIRQTDQNGEGQRFEDLFRVLHEAAGGVEDFRANSLGEDVRDDIVEDEINEEEDEDDEIDELEEELDDMDEDQGSFEGFDDEEVETWGWDGEEPPISRHHHHHHRFRGIPTGWTPVPSGIPHRHGGIIPIPHYRSHRTQITSRNNDDGTNPLLIRSDRGPDGANPARGPGNDAFAEWVQRLDPSSTARVLPVESPVSFMNAIMQAIGGQGAPGFGVISRPDGIHVHVDRRAIMPNRVQDIFGLGRPSITPTRTRDDPAQAVSFALAPTVNRWQEEARILFGGSYVEKTQLVINSILKLLVPPAIEEQQKRQKELEEEQKRREEKAKQEQVERLAKEEEERERKRKEEEEAAEERRRQAEQRAASGPVSSDAGEPMDDVQETGSTVDDTTHDEDTLEGEGNEEGPSEAPPQVFATIRGRQIDITGMDIDVEVLNALPEEIREEVVMSHLAEQRSQAVASGEEPTEISQEFLEALPPEIREELLQQEAAARRRRERETARRQANASGIPAHAEDMDPASFIATLDPSLRQAVLVDQPEEILASLGPEFLSEARALAGGRLAQFADAARIDSRPHHEERHDPDTKKNERRPVVQILDKAGVATLLRLMFMPLQGNARHQLNDILHNVCQNRQNRMEVVSLLLSILQDGTADVPAIERSFAHLSLRAKTLSTQKTPQSGKKYPVLPVAPSTNSDVTPLMVVQQCLGTLSFLTQYNPHISWSFLTERDSPSTLKLKAFRKGKGKENSSTTIALCALLSLLDRKMIMESPSCMEQLSSLLSSISQPLTLLARREKEKQEETEKDKAPEGKVSNDQEATTIANNPAEAEPSGQDTTMTDAISGPDTSVAVEGASTESTNIDMPKKKGIGMPNIPEYYFRLVVRILAARECSSKTFRDTVSTINNLSAIPGAKDVIGKELIIQAQGLSETILTDLDDLLPHIKTAQTGTDLQGLALANFSPASSDQAKLLRVLTALDYLFDPHRVDKSKGKDTESAPKDDVLKTLYENSTFTPLWTKLSDCLTIIRQKENMMNVATTLLPLIEALMVVCKNTTLKDAPLSWRGREFTIMSPVLEAGPSMESLFFKFTEEHRKVLNELVRQNPRLMSGTFSLLVKNPKVLEFDNKRNYFTRRIHTRTETRHPHPPLQLSVRRDQVFLDSFKSLYFKTADEVKYGKLSIRFHGEEGVDAGGVTREWFQVLARGMFNPNYALFIPVASDRTTFHPNRLSGVNSEHLMFFKFIGRIIGKALFEGRVLDCHFSRAVYKRILGKSVSIKDMETLDLDYYKSLLWMLENDITDILTETFAVETDDFGEKQVIDLIPNGRNIPVTQENKEDYIQRVVEYRLVGSVKEQLDNFLTGFHDIIPPELISIFNEQELELLISGLPEIDVDDWKNSTEYHNYSASSSQIQWFWRAVRSFDKEERAKLLQFVTGTSKVPLNGFKELEGMNGFSRFNIHRDYGNKDRLPSSHTCFNQLDLPEYESYDVLRQRLYTAMTAGSEYFGFA